MAFKQQKCISYGSGSWQVKDPGAGRWKPAFWFTDNYLLSRSHLVEGVRDLSGISFILGLILFIKPPPSGSNHFPKIQPSNIIAMEIKIQHMNFEGNINYSVYRNVYDCLSFIFADVYYSTICLPIWLFMLLQTI